MLNPEFTEKDKYHLCHTLEAPTRPSVMKTQGINGVEGYEILILLKLFRCPMHLVCTPSITYMSRPRFKRVRYFYMVVSYDPFEYWRTRVQSEYKRSCDIDRGIYLLHHHTEPVGIPYLFHRLIFKSNHEGIPGKNLFITFSYYLQRIDDLFRRYPFFKINQDFRTCALTAHCKGDVADVT